MSIVASLSYTQKTSANLFSTTKYSQIICFICPLLAISFVIFCHGSQYLAGSYYRYQFLSHSPPQQNFWQQFFSFRKVWGYPTALISWFINFNWVHTVIEVVHTVFIKIVLLEYLAFKTSNKMTQYQAATAVITALISEKIKARKKRRKTKSLWNLDFKEEDTYDLMKLYLQNCG